MSPTPHQRQMDSAREKWIARERLQSFVFGVLERLDSEGMTVYEYGPLHASVEIAKALELDAFIGFGDDGEYPVWKLPGDDA